METEKKEKLSQLRIKISKIHKDRRERKFFAGKMYLLIYSKICFDTKFRLRVEGYYEYVPTENLCNFRKTQRKPSVIFIQNISILVNAKKNSMYK